MNSHDQVTFTNISASRVLQLVVDNAYRELYNIVNHDEPPEERQKNLKEYIQKTRKRFVQILIIIKWLRIYGHETLVRDSHKVLDITIRQQNSILEAQDLLFFLHNKLFATHQAPYDVFSALQALSNGDAYRKSFPRAIEWCGQEIKITPPSQAETIAKLNHLIRLHLLLGEKPPKEFTERKIKDGALILGAGKEFELILTLEGEGPNFPWTLLRVNILLGGLSWDPTTRLLLPDKRQENCLHEVLIRAMTGAQENIDQLETEKSKAQDGVEEEKGEDWSAMEVDEDEKGEKVASKEDVAGPLQVAYEVCHDFCSVLQLEIINTQAVALSQSTWTEQLKVEYRRSARVLDLKIWASKLPAEIKEEPSKDEPINGVPPPKRAMYVRVFCDPNSNQNLTVVLGPQEKVVEGGVEEELIIEEGNLGAAQLLNAATQIFSHSRLRTLAKELRSFFEQKASADKDFAAMTVSFDENSHLLKVKGVTQGSLVEIGVEMRTGRYLVFSKGIEQLTAQHANQLQVALNTTPQLTPAILAVIGTKMKLLFASLLLEEIEQTALLTLGLKAARNICLEQEKEKVNGDVKKLGLPSRTDEDQDLKTFLPLSSSFEQGPARRVAMGQTDEHANFFVQAAASGPATVDFYAIMTARPKVSKALPSRVVVSHLLPHRTALWGVAGRGRSRGTPRGPRLMVKRQRSISSLDPKGRGGPCPLLSAMLGEVAASATYAIPMHKIWRGLTLEQDPSHDPPDMMFEDTHTLGHKDWKLIAFPISWGDPPLPAIQKIKVESLLCGGWEWRIEFHPETEIANLGMGQLHKAEFSYGGIFTCEIISGQDPARQLVLKLRYEGKEGSVPPAQMVARSVYGIAAHGLKAMIPLVTQAVALRSSPSQDYQITKVNLYEIQIRILGREIILCHASFHINHCIQAGSSDHLGFKLFLKGDEFARADIFKEAQAHLNKGERLQQVLPSVCRALATAMGNSNY